MKALEVASENKWLREEIERLRALLAEVCPPGLQKVSADLDARIRSALAAKGE